MDVKKVQEKHLTCEGGRLCLNEERTILLDVPKGALSENTVATWYIGNRENISFPKLIIEARSKDTGDEIKMFKKHVILTYKNIQSFPGHLDVITDGVAVPNQQVHPSEHNPSDHCIFHTFYKRNENDIMIFTRHFSHFLINCEEHGAVKKSTLFAVIFRSKVMYVKGTSCLDILIVLDINNTTRTKANKAEWMIPDYDDYELVKTITLQTPRGTEVVKPDATFRCNVSLEETVSSSWICINQHGEEKQLDHVIRCQKCRLIHHPDGTSELENLPEAVVLQFENTDAANVKTFRADFSFSIQPSEQEQPTVTRRRITIDVDVKDPICVESENSPQILASGNSEQKYTKINPLLESQSETEKSTLVKMIPTDNSWCTLSNNLSDSCITRNTHIGTRPVLSPSKASDTSSQAAEMHPDMNCQIKQEQEDLRQSAQSAKFTTPPSSPTLSQIYSSGYESVGSDSWAHFGSPEYEPEESPNPNAMLSAGENTRPSKRRRHWKSKSNQEPTRCLKDLDIYNISVRVDNSMILYRLALQLHVKKHEVQTAINNHCFSLQEAAHAVLSTWFLTQESPQEAFLTMRNALIQAGLQLIVNTVLDE